MSGLEEISRNIMGFGKYTDKTLGWVLENDLNYACWVSTLKLRKDSKLNATQRYISEYFEMSKGDTPCDTPCAPQFFTLSPNRRIQVDGWSVGWLCGLLGRSLISLCRCKRHFYPID
jgi:hypothetical protein